ncbi:MAG: hypothetical protein U5L96_14575 [Owenweeksia sp.]|nr:hypothetical protein [Owenweeksia sp.]
MNFAVLPVQFSGQKRKYEMKEIFSGHPAILQLILSSTSGKEEPDYLAPQLTEEIPCWLQWLKEKEFSSQAALASQHMAEYPALGYHKMSNFPDDKAIGDPLPFYKTQPWPLLKTGNVNFGAPHKEPGPVAKSLAYNGRVNITDPSYSRPYSINGTSWTEKKAVPMSTSKMRYLNY